MNDLWAWLAEHTTGAPRALRQRVGRWAAKVPAEGGMDERLGAAARRALDHAAGGPADRSVAADLLAADALITLALLARAETDPAGLAEFAAALRGSAARGA